MPNDPVQLQAFYTYAELSKLMGISRRRVERLCKNEGIVTHRVGKRHVVWVSEIEAHLPMMFRSLMTCLRARHMERHFQKLHEKQAEEAHAKAVTAEFERNERHIP